MKICLPPSPQALGYDHSVTKFRETIGGNDDEMFRKFRNELWENADWKPEISRLFAEAEEVSSICGKYFGKFLRKSCPCILTDMVDLVVCHGHV